jgi:predicted phage-related endonuclease
MSPTKSSADLEQEEAFLEEQICATQEELDNIHNVEADLWDNATDDYAKQFLDDAKAADVLLNAKMHDLLKEGKESQSPSTSDLGLN